MGYRELTPEEKTIYENSLKRLKIEIEDVDLLVRSQQMTVDEILAYNYKMQRKREEAQLQNLKEMLEEKKMALNDCIDKLKNGVEAK